MGLSELRKKNAATGGTVFDLPGLEHQYDWKKNPNLPRPGRTSVLAPKDMRIFGIRLGREWEAVCAKFLHREI